MVEFCFQFHPTAEFTVCRNEQETVLKLYDEVTDDLGLLSWVYVEK